MSRLLVVVGVALVAALVSVTGAVAANQTNVRVELTSTEFNPCTSEWVDLDVTVHVVLNLTVGRQNVSGTFHLDLHAQGIGQSSGAHYAGSEVDQDSFKASFVNGQANATDLVTFRLTRAGGANNWTIRGVAHVGVNANGDVAVSFGDLSESCA